MVHSCRNRLLTSLASHDREAVLALCEPVALDLKQVIETSGETIEQVYFLESGLVSVIAQSAPERLVEVGLIGNEGMTGLSIVLGDDLAVNRSIVQGEGQALRVAPASLRETMAARPAMREVFLRFVQSFLSQASQTALSNGRATIEERLARWILMSSDRMESLELILTHDFLSVMLGVRRPGVTVALHILEGQGLIKASRNRIAILDRAGLLSIADGSYGVSEAQYARLFPPLPQAAERLSFLAE